MNKIRLIGIAIFISILVYAFGFKGCFGKDVPSVGSELTVPGGDDIEETPKG